MNEIFKKCLKCEKEYPEHTLENGVCYDCRKKDEEAKKTKIEQRSKRDEIETKIENLKVVFETTDHFKQLGNNYEFLTKIVLTYGNIDYEREILKADLWLTVNKKKKKDYKRYIMNWLNKTTARIEFYKRLRQMEKEKF